MCGINPVSKNAAIVTVGDRAVGVLSWDGFRKIITPQHKMTEDDIIAKAMYLAQHGQREVGNDLIDIYCEGQNVSPQ